jgi:hypothetical protein
MVFILWSCVDLGISLVCNDTMNSIYIPFTPILLKTNNGDFFPRQSFIFLWAQEGPGYHSKLSNEIGILT